MGNKQEKKKVEIITLKIIDEHQKTMTYEISDMDESLEKYIDKFQKDIVANYSSLTILYKGTALYGPKLKAPISKIIKSDDKNQKEMTILLHQIGEDDKKELEEFNIILVIESEKRLKLTGKKGYTIGDNLSYIFKIDLKWCIFKYKEKEIDIKKNFDDIADKDDQKKKEIILTLNYRISLIVYFYNKSEKIKNKILCKLSDWVDIYFKNVKLDKDDYYFFYKNKKTKNHSTFHEIISDDAIQNCFTNENINDTKYFFATTDNIEQTNITTNNNKKIDMAIPVFPVNEKEDRKLEIEIKVIKKCCFVRCMIRISRCWHSYKVKKFRENFLVVISVVIVVVLHLLVFFGWIILFFIK